MPAGEARHPQRLPAPGGCGQPAHRSARRSGGPRRVGTGSASRVKIERPDLLSTRVLRVAFTALISLGPVPIRAFYVGTGPVARSEVDVGRRPTSAGFTAGPNPVRHCSKSFKPSRWCWSTFAPHLARLRLGLLPIHGRCHCILSMLMQRAVVVGERTIPA